MRARQLPTIAIFAVSALLLYLLYTESPIFTISENKPPFKPNLPLPRNIDRSSSSSGVSVVDSDHNIKQELDPLLPPQKANKRERIDWFRRKSKRFHGRVSELYKNNCSAQFFMVWLSPANFFGPRELLAVDTLFTANPGACLAILSNTLDSPRGYTVLNPFLDRGFNLAAVTLDIPFLVKNTPAEATIS